MERDVPGWTLGELAAIFDAELVGPADLRILRPIPADGSDPAGLTFAASPEYLRTAEAGGAGAVLAPRGSAPISKPMLLVDRPREAFGRFLAMSARPLPLNAGIHPTAVVSPEASVAESAQIGPYAVVERGAKIGERCRIFPHCYVGENCEIGDETILYPHVVLYQDVKVGARGILHSGAVLGADGFGFAWTGRQQMKIPQVGGVVLGDDVEIGANTAIDRATAGATTLGDDTKIDNLVQIGHNCRVGSHTVIASQTGISGSSRVGDRVTIAGQVATSDHVSITDDVVLGGRTAVTGNIDQPGAYLGFPARPLGEAMRTLTLQTKLQELFKRVKALEKKTEERS